MEILKSFKKNPEDVNTFAAQDKFTLDTKYNEGLRTIRKYGYEHVKTNDEVKYYCLCNNL